MAEGVLHPGIRIGPVALTVADLERQLAFYGQTLGLALLQRTDRSALVGAGVVPLLRLEQGTEPRARPAQTTGLYHFAILLPSRAALGHALLRLAEQGYPLQGAADHLVSEAVYLSDAEGNGIELYRDRPHEEWPWQAGQVQMANARLDFDGILAEARADAGPGGMPPSTRMGHVHLQVADLQQAETFYCDTLGFEVMARWPGAIFVSAGRYHHHLGLNVWETRGAPPAPRDAVGLRFYTIVVPDEDELRRLEARLESHGVAVERAPGRLALRDPWQIGIRLALPDAEPAWP